MVLIGDLCHWPCSAGLCYVDEAGTSETRRRVLGPQRETWMAADLHIDVAGEFRGSQWGIPLGTILGHDTNWNGTRDNGRGRS